MHHDTELESEKTTKEFSYGRNSKTKITNPPRTELVKMPAPPKIDFGETQYIDEQQVSD